ncbi:unnamed protein product [Brassicogethes aeneus]|uniref:RWD domain-containing protein n=1 Tax=Brassicogethes aeneus TaxID=1431903 RepID=A0A9P0FCN7_BRAAE|nr:unnamed protein product [Brassicogethes aeneus]
MDHAEEQKGEVEAIESIYYGDVQIISESPYYKFSIPIKTEEYDAEESQNGLCCDLVFTYTAKYPEEAPIIEIENLENFEENYESELLTYLAEQVKENLGMVMVFTIVSSAQEWLNVRYETVKKEQEEIASKILREEEEVERKRFEGTRVTVETFMKWKQQFEEEMGITKKKEIAEKEGKKLSGRELFMTDNTLNESDLKFLDGDPVKVDESLFQNIEDLDLDDSEDEDFEVSDDFEGSSDSEDYN